MSSLLKLGVVYQHLEISQSSLYLKQYNKDFGF